MLKHVILIGFLLWSTLSMAQPAHRIIVLSPQGIEMLYSIGAGDAIIAATDYADYPPAAKKLLRVGGFYGIQIERVVALNPDLIVVWGSGNKAGDIARLKQLGFAIYNSDPKSLPDVARDIINLGQLTGHQVQAEKVAKRYLEQLKQLRQSYQKKPAVTLFYQLSSTPLITVARNGWIQQIIKLCHGDNVFVDSASDYPQVSIEAVVQKMPQVILQNQNKAINSAIEWSKWPEIPAVKNHHIYQLDADLLHRAGPRTILGARALCHALDKAR